MTPQLPVSVLIAALSHLVLARRSNLYEDLVKLVWRLSKSV